MVVRGDSISRDIVRVEGASRRSEGGSGFVETAPRRNEVHTRNGGVNAVRQQHDDDPALPLVAGDVADKPIAPASCAAVLSSGVVEHFEEGPARALAEARRVLEPGGRLFVAVPSNSRYKTLDDLLADARARPGQLNYGSWSIGNPVHLGSALIESMTGTQMEHVVFKEVSQLYAAVGTGEINWALGTAASAGPMFRAGKIRFIAISAPTRQPTFPDVPTIAETPGLAGFQMVGWTALAVSPRTPKAVADKIYRDIEAALSAPEFKERYAAYGYELFLTSREQFQTFIASESAKFGAVIRRSKVALD